MKNLTVEEIDVALARTVPRLVEDGQHSFEPKFDGWRILLSRHAEGVTLRSRFGHTMTKAFPEIALEAMRLPEGTILDGELTVGDEHSPMSLEAVQYRSLAGEGRAYSLAKEMPAHYAAFDLLAMDGEDLRRKSYIHRKAALHETVEDHNLIQNLPYTLDLDLARYWYEDLFPEHGVEGMVMKRVDQPYPSGRREWLRKKYKGD